MLPVIVRIALLQCGEDYSDFMVSRRLEGFILSGKHVKFCGMIRKQLSLACKLAEIASHKLHLSPSLIQTEFTAISIPVQISSIN